MKLIVSLFTFALMSSISRAGSLDYIGNIYYGSDIINFENVEDSVFCRLPGTKCERVQNEKKRLIYFKPVAQYLFETGGFNYLRRAGDYIYNPVYGGYPGKKQLPLLTENGKQILSKIFTLWNYKTGETYQLPLKTKEDTFYDTSLAGWTVDDSVQKALLIYQSQRVDEVFIFTTHDLSSGKIIQSKQFEFPKLAFYGLKNRVGGDTFGFINKEIVYILSNISADTITFSFLNMSSGQLVKEVIVDAKTLPKVGKYSSYIKVRAAQVLDFYKNSEGGNKIYQPVISKYKYEVLELGIEPVYSVNLHSYRASKEVPGNYGDQFIFRRVDGGGYFNAIPLEILAIEDILFSSDKSITVAINNSDNSIEFVVLAPETDTTFDLSVVEKTVVKNNSTCLMPTQDNGQIDFFAFQPPKICYQSSVSRFGRYGYGNIDSDGYQDTVTAEYEPAVYSALSLLVNDIIVSKDFKLDVSRSTSTTAKPGVSGPSERTTETMSAVFYWEGRKCYLKEITTEFLNDPSKQGITQTYNELVTELDGRVETFRY